MISWAYGDANAVFTGAEDGNLALHVADAPAAVATRRARVAERVGATHIATARQVHGSDVAIDPPASWSDTRPGIDADAIVITEPGVAAAVLVSDCIPIVVTGPRSVAAIHAGWKGLVAGVIEAALDAMPGGAARAMLGPCIGPCCFEFATGAEEHFDDAHIIRGASVHVDLPAAAIARLAARGVAAEWTGECTRCSEQFFSYRRDGNGAGRQAGIVWRT